MPSTSPNLSPVSTSSTLSATSSTSTSTASSSSSSTSSDFDNVSASCIFAFPLRACASVVREGDDGWDGLVKQGVHVSDAQQLEERTEGWPAWFEVKSSRPEASRSRSSSYRSTTSSKRPKTPYPVVEDPIPLIPTPFRRPSQPVRAKTFPRTGSLTSTHTNEVSRLPLCDDSVPTRHKSLKTKGRNASLPTVVLPPPQSPPPPSPPISVISLPKTPSSPKLLSALFGSMSLKGSREPLPLPFLKEREKDEGRDPEDVELDRYLESQSRYAMANQGRVRMRSAC